MIWTPEEKHVLRIQLMVQERMGLPQRLHINPYRNGNVTKIARGTDAIEVSAEMCCALAKAYGVGKLGAVTSVATMLVMLRKNGIVLQGAHEELSQLERSIVKAEPQDVALWIRSHIM